MRESFLPSQEEARRANFGSILITNASSSLTVQNGPIGGAGGYGSTYITQPFPSLCRYVYYTLSFDAQTAVYGGQAGLECKLEISIGDRVIVYNGPGGDLLPFAYQRRTYTILQNRSSGAYALTVRFTCTAPSGVFMIDNISLVGQGYS